MVSENTSKIMLIGPPIMDKRSFKKLKIVLFLLLFIFKTKIVDIFNFPSLKCFGYSLSFLSIWHILLNYCWNYGLSNLLFRFTWYSWQQLNNRQRKTAVNLLIYFLKGTINSSVWWKFQVFWPSDHKMTTLWNFCKIEWKGHFIGSFWQVFGISE